MTPELKAELAAARAAKRKANPVLGDLDPDLLRIACDYVKEHHDLGVTNPLTTKHARLKYLRLDQEKALCDELPHAWRAYGSRRGNRTETDYAAVFEEATIRAVLEFCGIGRDAHRKYIRFWRATAARRGVVSPEEASRRRRNPR
jgi:hypothetical protein